MQEEVQEHHPAGTEASNKMTVVTVEILSKMEVLPISADIICQATQRNPVLSLVMEQTKRGWPTFCEKELEPLFRRKMSLPYKTDACFGQAHWCLSHQNIKHKC